MLEFLFNKIVGQGGKQIPTQVFLCEICEVFKNIFFIEHLRRLLFCVFDRKLKTQYNLVYIW